ncbi:MAG TPA: DUF4157 domain-containing protein [Kofleriaceae bacterium]|nr:DUF4157 domain-containing protein [Kofleriaceae bacterium]
MSASVYAAASDPAVIQRKEAGGTAPAPTPSAAPAIGSGQPLPGGFRAEMESFLGIDLSAVRVHQGGQAGDAGAVAYAKGSDIFMAPGTYDPESPHGRELLGHELAHIAQQARGQVKANTDVGGLPVNNDASLEKEADAIGAQAARGSTRAPARGTMPAPAALAPASSDAAPAQRKEETLSGDPNNRVDSAGKATTNHKSPTLGDSANAPGAAPAAGTEARATNVRVIAGEANKMHVEPATSCPDPARIYEETRRAESPAPAGFTTVTGFAGTMTAPQVEQEASKSIYIDNNPTAADVQQAGIGDCYFLAAVMSVAARDPGKLKSIIAADGNGGATVTLWRAVQKAPSILDRLRGRTPPKEWIPVSVSVDDKLAFNVGPGGRVHGAQLRAAQNAKASDYWSKVGGTNLEIHRKDIYDCARWAPLLEKAYARFAQTHGRSGGAGGGTAQASGYDAINGGNPLDAFQVLYGPESDNPDNQMQWHGIAWSPGTANIVTANTAVMDQLALIQGKGAELQPGEQAAPIITASAHVDTLIGRLEAAIPAAQADPDWANVAANHQANVAGVLPPIAAWKALPPDPQAPAPQPKLAARAPIGNACVAAVRPGFDDNATDHDASERFKHWTRDPIYFGAGDDTVSAEAATRLGGFNNNLSVFKRPQVKVQIDGYASSDGTAPENQSLSQRRADNVETAITTTLPIAPHTTAKAAHGATGTPHDASQRKVDLSFSTTADRVNSLLDPARSAPIRAMTDLMLDLRNVGTDNSIGQRNIYGDHAYSVVAVNFVDAAGGQVNLAGTPTASRGPLYSTIDPNASTVRVRNPHHTNEPDRAGDNKSSARDGDPAGRGSDGIFTMTLTEFFRNFCTVESAKFKRT